MNIKQKWEKKSKMLEANKKWRAIHLARLVLSWLCFAGLALKRTGRIGWAFELFVAALLVWLLQKEKKADRKATKYLADNMELVALTVLGLGYLVKKFANRWDGTSGALYIANSLNLSQRALLLGAGTLLAIGSFRFVFCLLQNLKSQTVQYKVLYWNGYEQDKLKNRRGGVHLLMLRSAL